MELTKVCGQNIEDLKETLQQDYGQKQQMKVKVEIAMYLSEVCVLIGNDTKCMWL